MRHKHNIAERPAKTKLAMRAQLAGGTLARNGAADPRESMMERISQERGLRLLRESKSKPPI
jgi:hypothetical protein